MTDSEKIFVAGHRGMAGSAILRKLRLSGHPEKRLVTRNREELDLTRQDEVDAFFESEKPGQVYLAAAKVGGIHANSTYPAQFIYENLMIESNVIHAAFRNGVRKLLFLGSSCIYPKYAPQPITESSLLTGPLEPTNEPYAIAKIAGILLCESYNRQYGRSRGIDYRCVMPTNLFGPGDNYHPENSHVVPGLIRRFHEAFLTGAAGVTIWGSGTPRREFLYVDDMAAACIHVMNLDAAAYASSVDPRRTHINVGSGQEVSIRQLAGMVAETVGYRGNIAFDPSRPDGTPRKLLDTTCLHRLGWRPSTTLRHGLALAYDDFIQNHAS